MKDALNKDSGCSVYRKGSDVNKDKFVIAQNRCRTMKDMNSKFSGESTDIV